MHPYVHSSTIHHSQDMETNSPSTDEWIQKMGNIHSGILLSHKKNEIMPFAATWMELETAILSEVSQTEKEKYRMASLICRI